MLCNYIKYELVIDVEFEFELFFCIMFILCIIIFCKYVDMFDFVFIFSF